MPDTDRSFSATSKKITKKRKELATPQRLVAVNVLLLVCKLPPRCGSCKVHLKVSQEH